MKKYFGAVLLVFLSAGILLTAQKANPVSDFEYDLNSEGTGVVIKKYKGTSKDVIIPSMIEDFPIVKLGYDSFKETKIVSVIIPNSVTIIDRECFSKCKYLEKVTLPKGLESLGGSCFYECEALKEIVLSQGLVKISDETFSNSGLESIVIPDSVQEIDYWAFQDCISLTSITIPDSVTTIGSRAFEKCKNLKTITVGTGLESISNDAFKECTALTSIILGDNLKYIDDEVFCGCTSLTSVKIGKGINRIGKEAFKDCSSLTTFDIGVKKLPYFYNSELWKKDINGYLGDVFKGCSSLSLKEKKKIKDSGYKGEF